MFNPVLHTKKVFRDQVKACLNNTFGADTNKHINKKLMKRDTRVLALVFFIIRLGISIQGKCSEC